MANNKVSSLLNIDLPKPKRSNFNLGRVNRFSADVGWIIPCYVEEILPNSYKRLDLEGLVQTNATIAPLMGTFKIKVDAFFVPLRLYYRHLDLNNIRPDFDDNFEYHYFNMPTVDNVQYYEPLNPNSNEVHQIGPSTSTGYTSLKLWSDFDPAQSSASTLYAVNLTVAPGSLIDYLGMLPAGYNAQSWKGEKRVNANPFIGYFDIFRNYYANPHDPKVPFRFQNTYVAPSPQGTTDIIVESDTNDVYFDLRCFDYFIQTIYNSSSYEDQPYAINAALIFKEQFNLSRGSAPIQFVEHPPLFAGEAVGLTEGLQRGRFYAADTRDGIHFGLLRRTYMDDYFNSRFRNDFVAYMTESSRVDVSAGSFTIDQLRLANRTAKYIDKSIFSDTRFGSWIKAHFGVKTNAKLNIPQFLGSMSTNLVFNDIYSTAQTGDGDIKSNQALGSRSSLGQGYLKGKGSFVEFQASEPGYLMCMFSIIPYVSYFEGIKKMYLKTSFNDMYKPEFDAVGYDDLQKLELFAIGSYSTPYNNNLGIEAVDLAEYNVSIGKHPAYLEYMTSFDESHGLFTQRNQLGYYVLNRTFAPNVYDADTIPVSGSTAFSVPAPEFIDTTYIQPEMFNSIFAVNKYTDNFQVQLRFYDKTKQPMSKQILPHL